MIKKIGNNNVIVPLGIQMSRLNGLIMLNESAAYLWKLLSDECTKEELISAFANNFELSVEIARRDVQDFLNDIHNLDLLES